MNTKFLLMLLCPLLMTGCWGYKPPSHPSVLRAAPPPAPISHIVFVTLKDPADLGKLQVACDQQLGTIPGVAAYACGPHLDTGRESVLHDYDLALYLGFKTEDDLAAYVAHPRHVTLVENWKPRIESLRVYDMVDQPAPVMGYCGTGGRKKFLGVF